MSSPSTELPSRGIERRPSFGRERRPSVGAPLIDIQGSVGPAGISRPKHKRTVTGFSAQEIKSVEGESQGMSDPSTTYPAPPR